MTAASLSRPAITAQQRLVTGIVALVLGLVLMYGVGFAHSTIAHNAAHDTRHAIGFPCH